MIEPVAVLLEATRGVFEQVKIHVVERRVGLVISQRRVERHVAIEVAGLGEELIDPLVVRRAGGDQIAGNQREGQRILDGTTSGLGVVAQNAVVNDFLVLVVLVAVLTVAVGDKREWLASFGGRGCSEGLQGGLVEPRDAPVVVDGVRE